MPGDPGACCANAEIPESYRKGIGEGAEEHPIPFNLTHRSD